MDMTVTLSDWESKLDLIKRTVAAGASPDELELFLYQCKRTGLDPLARQIYYVKRQGKGVTQVGIDGLRLIADRTGLYAGNDDADFSGVTDSGYPAKTRVTVYKMVQGQRCAFTATARWDEYYPGDAQGFQWRKMPHAMLAKCAEALALRKAFPADMSGLYVHEEMGQAGSVDAETGEVIEKSESSSSAASPTAKGSQALTAMQLTSSEREAFKSFCIERKVSWSRLAAAARAEGAMSYEQLMRYVESGAEQLMDADAGEDNEDESDEHWHRCPDPHDMGAPGGNAS